MGGGMFSFSDDVLGIGKSADRGEAHADCGVRPNCLFGSHCEKNNEAYEACLSKAMDKKYSNQMQQISASSKNTTTYVIAGIAVVLLLVFLFRKKK